MQDRYRNHLFYQFGRDTHTERETACHIGMDDAFGTPQPLYYDMPRLVGMNIFHLSNTEKSKIYRKGRHKNLRTLLIMSAATKNCAEPF